MNKSMFGRKTGLTAIVSMLSVFLLVDTLRAQPSLFESRNNSKAFLFQDLKARRVGDLLTIMVSENTDVNNQDQRGNRKASSAASSFAAKFGLGGIFGSSAGNASGSQSVDSKREFDGESSFSVDRSFSDRFTVQVVDVLPNGNMLVSGTRQVNVENDSRCLKLTGMIRPYDINADNTVNSRLVANLSLKYDSTGPEQAFTKQGWLARRMNRIWPF